MKKIALIPTYQPDKKLIELVEELKNNGYDTIVVNDGSSAIYENIFKECRKLSTVISYDTNMGKGFALKKGLQYIKDNYTNYIVVTLDSDGQHTVNDATKLYKYIEKNPDTLVLGKRLINKNTPLRSKLGNTITRKVFNLVSGQYIYDTQTGLRAFSDKLTNYMLSIKGNRYEYEMNILLNAKKNSIKVEELEIETIYIDNNSGSHFNTIKDSYRIYKEIIKFSLSSLLSFIIDYILYIIFLTLFKNITISNILARLISATFNYNVNRNIVFKSNDKVINTLFGYILLATTILLLNTIILNALVYLKINALIAKIFTEIILFIFSYTIQKKIIFNKEKINEN